MADTWKAAPVEPARNVGGIDDADSDQLIDQFASSLDQNVGEIAVQAAQIP